MSLILKRPPVACGRNSESVGYRSERLAHSTTSRHMGKKCENEHCAVIVGKYDGKVKPNPKVAYGYKWASLGETLKEIRKKPESFVIWARLGAKVLRNNNLGKRLLITGAELGYFILVL